VRGQSQLGNGWPRKRAGLWPAGSLWLGQREERKKTKSCWERDGEMALGECGDLKWWGGPWLSGYGRAKAKDPRGMAAVFQKISKVGGCSSFSSRGSIAALGERKRAFLRLRLGFGCVASQMCKIAPPFSVCCGDQYL